MAVVSAQLLAGRTPNLKGFGPRLAGQAAALGAGLSGRVPKFILHAMRRVNQEAIDTPFRRPNAPERQCEHPGCAGEGLYRAPVGRDRLDQYYWFCLDHVRAYNLAWDFFAGMSESEIEYQRRHDTVWQRPSWPFGRFGESRAGAGDAQGPHIHDGFGFFSDRPNSAEARPQSPEQKALAVLDLRQPVTFEDVRARYKVLVKMLHPDANGGDTAAEERLKAVNQAYAALKISFA